MSSLSKIVENFVESYIDLIHEKFPGTDKKILKDLWNANSTTPTSSTSIFKKPTSGAANELMNLTKGELVELCRTKNLKVSGSKCDLIKRIEEKELNKVVKKVNAEYKPPPVLKKLVEPIQQIKITRNAFQNYEHEETHFVFDNVTKKVIGKQNSDGTISDLTHDDIDICNKYKFPFVIPENLDKNKTTEEEYEEEYEEIEVNESLDDLNDDDDEEEVEVEEEEEFEYDE